MSLEDQVLLATRLVEHDPLMLESRRADRRAAMIAAAISNQMARNWGGKMDWKPENFLWMLQEPQDLPGPVVIPERFHEAMMKGIALNQQALAKQGHK